MSNEFSLNVVDASFEIAVRQKLHSLGARNISHSGSYIDFTTGKLREYDLRCVVNAEGAISTQENSYYIEESQLSVECKNLGEDNFAVLVSDVDSVNHIDISMMNVFNVHLSGRRVVKDLIRCPSQYNFQLYHSVDLYTSSDGRLERGRANDKRDFYERWSQSVHSLVDIISSFPFYENVRGDRELRALVLPVTVVPDGHLLGCYINEVSTVVNPVPVEVGFYSLGAEIPVKDCEYPRVWVNVAAFVTLSGLSSLLRMLEEL